LPPQRSKVPDRVRGLRAQQRCRHENEPLQCERRLGPIHDTAFGSLFPPWPAQTSDTKSLIPVTLEEAFAAEAPITWPSQ
jgi:hypothetical protein